MHMKIKKHVWPLDTYLCSVMYVIVLICLCLGSLTFCRHKSNSGSACTRDYWNFASFFHTPTLALGLEDFPERWSEGTTGTLPIKKWPYRHRKLLLNRNEFSPWRKFKVRETVKPALHEHKDQSLGYTLLRFLNSLWYKKLLDKFKSFHDNNVSLFCNEGSKKKGNKQIHQWKQSERTIFFCSCICCLNFPCINVLKI